MNGQDNARISSSKRHLRQLANLVINLDSTMSLDEVLTQAVHQTSQVMKAERTTLFLVNETGELISRVLEGETAQEVRLSPGQGLAGWTARHGLPIHIEDAYQDERFDRQFDKLTGFVTQEVLCQPITGRSGVIIGVVEVMNCQDGRFSSDDLNLLGAVASQLAMAIENSRIVVDLVAKNRLITTAKLDLEKRNQELEILLQLEQVFARTDNLDMLGKESFAFIVRILDCELGSLYLIDATEANKRIYSADGRIHHVHRVEAGAGFTGWVAARNQELLLDEPSTDPRYERSIQRRSGITLTNLAACPLPFGEEENIAGAIMVCNKTGQRRFDQTDQMLLRLIARQMANAVSRLRHRQERERDRRLATVGRLLAGVLHDLKTPITAISGYAELLAEPASTEERNDYLAHIKGALERIRSMTADIVSFTKGERDLLITSVHLEEFIERYKADVTNYLTSRQVELIIRARTGGSAKLDPEKLLRAFHNITINAAEAMPVGGKLVFEVDRIEDRLMFSFTDTGTGVPEQVQGSLFNSFVSFGKHEGTGLGLAVAREIVAGHGGQISFTTASGAGTTFLITIPG